MIPVRVRFGGDFLFRLNPAAPANVLHAESVAGEDPAHQQSPVARGRVFLGAKQGDFVISNSPLQPRQSLLEQAGGCDAVVQDMPIRIVKFVSIGPAAKFPPKIEIPDSSFLNRQLQRLLVKLRGIFRVGLGTRVHDHLHALRLQ